MLNPWSDIYACCTETFRSLTRTTGTGPSGGMLVLLERETLHSTSAPVGNRSAAAPHAIGALENALALAAPQAPFSSLNLSRQHPSGRITGGAIQLLPSVLSFKSGLEEFDDAIVLLIALRSRTYDADHIHHRLQLTENVLFHEYLCQKGEGEIHWAWTSCVGLPRYEKAHWRELQESWQALGKDEPLLHRLMILESAYKLRSIQQLTR